MEEHECYPAPYNPKEPLFLDTETCGFAGFPVLIQFKIGRYGPVVIHHVGHSPAYETIELIEFLMRFDHVGFNYTFDMFQLIKAYNCLISLDAEHLGEWVIDLMDEIEDVEMRAFKKPFALRPPRVNDLMLFCRSTALQMCMNRKNVHLRRVPIQVASEVATYLDAKIQLPGILFARRKQNKSARFVAELIKDEETGEYDSDFMDVVLRFAPSTALKALAAELKLIDATRLLFTEVSIDSRHYPKEFQFAPFAKTIPDPMDRWTYKYKYHCAHWIKAKPLEYAEADVHDTANIYYYFLENPDEYGIPDWNSTDNDLVALVANTRYRGFKVDLKQIDVLAIKAKKVMEKAPHNFKSHIVVRKYITEVVDGPVEMILTDSHTGKISTKGDNLKALAQLDAIGETCEDCFGEGCEVCDDEGTLKVYDEHGNVLKHPAAIRAREVLEYRHMQKELELYNKLKICGYICPDVKIIGAKSSRMSGAGGFNFQGVKNADYVRKAFTLKDPEENLQIGDLDAFEVSIMAAVYNDQGLIDDLLSGKKIHGLFAQALFPDKTYDEIAETKKLAKEYDLYGKGKAGVFCMMYGGSENKVAEAATVDVQIAANAFHLFGDRYKDWKIKFDHTKEKHAMLAQKGGPGSKVEILEAQEFAETLFGFKRYFNIDYMMIKEIFLLSENIPKEWYKILGKVTRKDRQQTVVGACRTALFASAFGLQSAVIRQSQNHEIQGSGAYVTKKIQSNVWKLQPVGVHPLLIRAIQIHDEVICVGKPYLKGQVAKAVADTVASFKDKIPLIGMDWDIEADSWADK